MDDNCNHDKAYSNFTYCSCPAQYPWICRKCGAQGVDRDKYVDLNEYDQLQKHFSKEPIKAITETTEERDCE